jgi:hypothetical protein
MAIGQELELVTRLQSVLYQNIGRVRDILGSSPDAVIRRYDSLAEKNPLWSRGQLIQTMTKVSSRGATRLGGAAGGLAFLPGWGTALAFGLVASSSPKMLRYSVDAIDAVAWGNGFDLQDERLCRAGRVCVLYWTIPEGLRLRLSSPPPVSASNLMSLTPSELENLLRHADEIVLRWGSAVGSWRIASLAPYGTGAFAGAWASYLPIKYAVRAAEEFYSIRPDRLLTEMSQVSSPTRLPFPRRTNSDGRPRGQ